MVSKTRKKPVEKNAAGAAVPVPTDISTTITARNSASVLAPVSESVLAPALASAPARAPAPRRKPSMIVDAKLRDRFLTALRDCGAVGVAAERVGSNRFAMLRAREHNTDFAAAWDLAMGRVPIPAIDAAKLEKALFKRLLRGVKRNRLFQGEIADVYRVYEDRLAFAMLGRLMPDKYGAATAGFAAEPVEAMSREEFMALISAKPRSAELPRFD